MIWTFDYPLQTDRLDLRPHRMDDLDDLQGFHGDPEVTLYIPWPTRDRDQTREALTAKLTQGAATAPGEWIVLAVEERDSGTVVGEILLKRISSDRAEVGYVLAAQAQGRGYAREAVAHLLSSAHQAFGVTTVDAVVDERNVASVRLLERMGFGAVGPDRKGLLTYTLEIAPNRLSDGLPRDAEPLMVDGLDFVMISSTASRVDPQSPTLFHYHQDRGLVWGEYSGDTVTSGRFVGRAVDGRIEISFAHDLLSEGSVVLGSAVSVAERRGDGLLYLIEEFEKDGIAHTSVCKQVIGASGRTHEGEL